MNQFLDKFLKFLQSNQAILLAAIMSLATQLWHSVKAFVALDVGGSGNYWNYLFGILFSVSTSFAILIFTVRGRKWLAYFFLLVEVFINVIHYNLMNMGTDSTLIATLFMCIIVPVTISVYSAEVELEPEMTSTQLTPNIQTLGMNDSEFLKEINQIIGFDITDTKDKSGKPSPAIKAELRELWKKRSVMKQGELKTEIRKILNTGQPLFKS